MVGGPGALCGTPPAPGTPARLDMGGARGFPLVRYLARMPTPPRALSKVADAVPPRAVRPFRRLVSLGTPSPLVKEAPWLFPALRSGSNPKSP